MKQLILLIKRGILKLCWSQNWFSKPLEEQRTFLSGLPEPVDDFERSYFQHKCQCFFKKPWQIFLMNCAALPLLVLHSIQFRKTKVIPETHVDAVFLDISRDNIIPLSLKKEFPFIRQVKDVKGCQLLSKEDLRFLKKLRKRYPFSFFFRYECMRELATYSYLIARHSPRALLSVEQRHSPASFLSAYCETRGVEHINLMHGIQAFDISLTFLKFHRFYVWNTYFQDLFIELGAAKDQFVVEVPPSLRFPQTISSLEHVNYTYYLQDQPLPKTEKIANALFELKKRGAKIAVRPHPLYMDCVQFFASSDYGFILEDPSHVLIEDSVLRTDHVIAESSTVLMQAYYNGKTAVIDDIFSPEIYAELEKTCYMNRNMPHKLLSQILLEAEKSDASQQGV